MTLLAEVYDQIDAAIGMTAIGGYKIINVAKTKNAGLIAQGFTETQYVLDAEGTKWTVHRNPTAGKYGGAHQSSCQPNQP